MKTFSSLSAMLVLLFGLVAHSMSSEEVTMTISPATLNLNSQGTWVTIHADIPYAETVAAHLLLDGVEVAFTKADSQGDLVAKFCVDDVKGIVAPPSATLTLEAFVETPEGTELLFSGTDTIAVVKTGR